MTGERTMTSGWTVPTRIYQLRLAWYIKTMRREWCDSWFLTELMKLMVEERHQHITIKATNANG